MRRREEIDYERMSRKDDDTGLKKVGRVASRRKEVYEERLAVFPDHHATRSLLFRLDTRLERAPV